MLSTMAGQDTVVRICALLVDGMESIFTRNLAAVGTVVSDPDSSRKIVVVEGAAVVGN